MEKLKVFKAYLRRFFNIHPQDIEKIINLSILNFLVVGTSSMGISIATSLFLKRYGLAYLPKMYLINAALIILGTFMLFTGSYLRRINLLAKISFVFGIIIISIRIIMIFEVNLVFPVLYSLSAMIFWLFYTQFWTLAVEICDVREGKRIFSYVVSAGLLGGGIAGLLIKSLIGVLHTENLLFLWAILFFVIVYFLKTKSESFKVIPFKAIQQKGQESDFVFQMKDTLSYFLNTSLVRMLVVSFLLYGIVIYMLDFQFNKIMNASFSDLDGLTSFYGVYSIVFYITTFFIQFFLTSYILKNMGTANTLFMFPSVLSMSFALLLVKFGYFTGLIARFSRDVLGYSLIDSAYPLLFSPLKEGYRNSVLALIEGVIIPLGTASAGALLLIFNDYSNFQISMVALVLAVIWLYFTLRLKESYRSIFVHNLAERTLPDIYPFIGQLTDMSEKRTSIILRDALKDKNDRVSLFAIQTLGKSKDPQALNYLISYLKENPSHVRRATIIKTLGESRDTTLVQTLSKYLEDPDPRVRANTIESLGIIGGNNIKELVRPFLNDTEMRVRINAAIVLWKFGDTSKGIEILSKSIKDQDEYVRVRSVYSLSQIATEDALAPLLEASKDPSAKVRLETAIGLSRIEKKEASLRLIQMLDDPDRRVEQSAYKGLVQKKGIKDLLIQKADASDNKMSKKVISILAERQEEKAAVFKYLQDEIKEIYTRIIWIKTFNNEKTSPGLALFLATLKNRNRMDIDKILKISSNIEGSTIFGLIIKRLKDKDQRIHAEVLELMENLRFESMTFLKSIIPLLEDTPVDELVRIAKSQYNIDEQSPEKIFKEILAKKGEEWFKGCVLYIIGERRLRELYQNLTKYVGSKSLFLREVSLEAIYKMDKKAAGEIATKLMYDEGLYVRALARKVAGSTTAG